MHGKIKNVFRDREFGFIVPDDGDADVYFHRSNVQPDTYVRLAPGQRVTFEVKTGNRGKNEGFNLVIESPQNLPQTMVSETPVAADGPNFAAIKIEQSPPPPAPVAPPPLPSMEKTQEVEVEEAVESDEAIRRSKRGKVRDFDTEKGYGFIAPDEGCILTLFLELAAKRFLTGRKRR